MTRISENSSSNALQSRLNRMKDRLEVVRNKTATLKEVNRPSDNPVNSMRAIELAGLNQNNDQYLKNVDHALLNLRVTETALEQISEVMLKAKEIAIAQSSDFYDAKVKKNLAQEVQQLKESLIAIGNRKLGPRHIFGGHKTLTPPFDAQGVYRGDENHIQVEIDRNFFVPINLHGGEIFQVPPGPRPPDAPPGPEGLQGDRSLASQTEGPQDFSAIALLAAFETALEDNDAQAVRSLLDPMDNTLSHLVTLRTRMGAVTNSVERVREGLVVEKLENEGVKSQLVDADILSLFSDLTKQQDSLEVAYKSANQGLQKNLLDFIL